MATLRRLLGPLAGKGRSSGLDADRAEALTALSRALGVRFRDLTLLNQALMHRSYVHDVELDRAESNERMEFLGDAVLGLLVNEHLYYKYERRQEGRLTKIKSLVVSEAILSRKAEELSLGDYILLSENERSSGGATRASIIADAFEAVIGAVFLDSGLKHARRFVEAHLLHEIDELLEVDEYRNYKSMVQEYAQRKFGSRPRYRVVSAKGPEHERVFFVELRLGGRALGRGEGKNKKEAEQLAARSALAKLGLLENGEGRKRSSRRRRGGRGRSRRRKKEKTP
jgi:ribonuclease-3